MQARRPALMTLLVAPLLVLAPGCGTAPSTTGPTVGIRNDSNVTLRARFWTGDRSEHATATPDDMRSERTLVVPPGSRERYKLGLLSRYRSSSESFVRVQIEPLGASFDRQLVYWFELNPPPPYTVLVKGDLPDLRFERETRGGMVAVPKHLWGADSDR